MGRRCEGVSRGRVRIVLGFWIAIQRGCSARSTAAGERDSVEGGQGGTLGSAVMGRNCERLCEDGRGLSFFLIKSGGG